MVTVYYLEASFGFKNSFKTEEVLSIFDNNVTSKPIIRSFQISSRGLCRPQDSLRWRQLMVPLGAQICLVECLLTLR